MNHEMHPQKRTCYVPYNTITLTEQAKIKPCFYIDYEFKLNDDPVNCSKMLNLSTNEKIETIYDYYYVRLNKIKGRKNDVYNERKCNECVMNKWYLKSVFRLFIFCEKNLEV